MKKPSFIWNLIFFQLSWFAIAFSASHNQPSLGITVGFLFICNHLAHHPHLLHEIWLMIRVTAIGIAIDSILILNGLVEFKVQNSHPFEHLPPLWIMVLWICFSATISTTFAWMTKRPWLAGLLGAIGAPVAYWSGFKIGAINSIMSPAGLISIGALWAVAFPLMLYRSVSN